MTESLLCGRDHQNSISLENHVFCDECYNKKIAKIKRTIHTKKTVDLIVPRPIDGRRKLNSLLVLGHFHHRASVAGDSGPHGERTNSSRISPCLKSTSFDPSIWDGSSGAGIPSNEVFYHINHMTVFDKSKCIIYPMNLLIHTISPDTFRWQ